MLSFVYRTKGMLKELFNINKACDIYVARFLADVRFGKALFPDPAKEHTIKLL